jgi:hypothetical protein
MNNEHVIKRCRWQCFLATNQNRQLAQFYWATQERIERKRAKGLPGS